MVLIDLHVHSHFSAHPSEWFLQRLGTRESYTDLETVYQLAKSRGMTMMTITDHNEIAGSVLLKERYPHHVITGVEATTYFPENGCKVHVLVYGLDEEQFRMINHLRSDIYQLRDYLKEQNLAHAVAHPTFSINKKLNLEYLERLFLLFDYFEGINGSRSRISNEVLMETLAVLTPEKIDDLYRKYRIEPYSDTPWIKGMIGGTDDHSGLFIGKTYTCADAETPVQLLEELKKKRVSPMGRHNDFQGLAFAIYKIAYEFSKTRSNGFSLPLFNSINQLIFEQNQMGIKDRLVFEKMKYSKSTKENTIKQLLLELVNTFKKNENFSIDAKLNCVYEKIAKVSDEFFRIFIAGIEQGLSQGDITVLIKNISGAIPSIFLSLPFFSTMNLLHGSRALLNDLTCTYQGGLQRRKRKVLWFAEVVDELGEDIFSFISKSNSNGDDSDEIVVVASLPEEGNNKTFSFPFLKVPVVYTYSLPFRSNYTLIFPSLLTSLKLIYDACPDKIIVSDPGPFGFLGLLASRLLHVPCVGVYPSGMVRQAIEYVEDEKMCRMIEDFTRWFYSLTDTIAVPSEEYIDMLRIKGYDGDKISVCPIEDSIDLSTSITNCKQSLAPTLLHTPF
jgi:predicted metal-dependent phosphoesterase TrpH